MKKYKYRFHRVVFKNRWIQEFPTDNYCFLGIYTKWFCMDKFLWGISLFGFSFEIWIKKLVLKTKKEK